MSSWGLQLEVFIEDVVHGVTDNLMGFLRLFISHCILNGFYFVSYLLIALTSFSNTFLCICKTP